MWHEMATMQAGAQTARVHGEEADPHGAAQGTAAWQYSDEPPAGGEQGSRPRTQERMWAQVEALDAKAPEGGHRGGSQTGMRAVPSSGTSRIGWRR